MAKTPLWRTPPITTPLTSTPGKREKRSLLSLEREIADPVVEKKQTRNKKPVVHEREQELHLKLIHFLPQLPNLLLAPKVSELKCFCGELRGHA